MTFTRSHGTARSPRPFLTRFRPGLVLAILGLSSPAGAQEGSPTARPAVVAVPLQGSIVLDGRLDEAVWTAAPAVTAFTQRDPREGEPASEATEVRIVYDREAIYVGARLHDRSPVTTRLGRRDMQLGASDWFRVSFDSYHDRRTAFRFDVNPSGVRRDATLGTGGFGGGGGGGGGRGGGGGGWSGGGFTGFEGDLAWDAVWDAQARVDDQGWTVEMRIPFSQLRFSPAEEQTWGLQLERILDRRQELAVFSFSRKSEPGGVPAFGELTGLRGVRPGRPLEVVPYALSQGSFQGTESNPFRSDRELDAKVGLDARYRITSNLTLSATVNPDFGQVEVDPAIINLSAFETRLDEKRPFFVEGSSSFRFGGNTVGPSAAAAGLLYSRRLGRAPQLGAPTAQAHLPAVTDILGAAKLSGKTSTGWSLGFLNAVTGREEALYLDGQGARQTAEVEPLSNYFVGRVNREFRRGQTNVGAIFTSVNRHLGDDRVASTLRSDAYSGGVDFLHEWAARTWSVSGFLVGSDVRGSESAILRTQRASTRYFQRPDAESFRPDGKATALRGYAGTVQLRKAAGEHWTGDWWVSTVSPGYEINDMGFQQRADRVASGGGVRYNERQPGRVLRSWSASLFPNFARNYDGDWIEKVFRGMLSMTHLSYWQLELGGSYELERIDDRLTRGGPLALRPAQWNGRIELSSDPRKSITTEAEVGLGADEAGGWERSVQVSAQIRTSPRWNLSLGPQLQRSRQDAQYVTAVADPAMTSTFGTRYIFAPLDQTELSLVTRLNYTFTPDLTLEVYAQPLVANGEYGTPKEFQAPSGYRFATYGRELGTLARSGNRWRVDPDGSGPARSFTVSDRSFTTRSLRGNAVLRWEYRPGSTFYAVWQQERLNPELSDHFRIGSALGGLLEGEASNVLVLKWSYWFNP